MTEKKRTYATYTQEFKILAISQFNAAPAGKRGAVAKKLGVAYNNLYNWSRKAAAGGVEALYRNGSFSGAGKKRLSGARSNGEHMKRQRSILAELKETCDELQKLRENYADREAMVLGHIRRLTKSLDRAVLPAKH